MRIPESELILNPDGSIYHLNLRPEHIAKNIITVGDPDRVSRVSCFFDSIDFRMAKREFVTHTGTYKGKTISVISTGMGTDNIEIFMNEIDALVNIDLSTRTEKAVKKSLNIIRIGTSGSLQQHVPLDAHLASHTAIGLDTLMCFYQLPQTDDEIAITTAFQQALLLPFRPYCVTASAELAQRIAFDMIPGHTLTCPGFYAPQGRQIRLATKLDNLVAQYNAFRYNAYQITNFEMETAGYYSLGRLLGHHVLSLNAIVAHRLSNQFSVQPEKTMDELIMKVLDRL